MTAIDDKQQVLWKRQLNTVIASVYGVVGNDFVPVSVVEYYKGASGGQQYCLGTSLDASSK